MGLPGADINVIGPLELSWDNLGNPRVFGRRNRGMTFAFKTPGMFSLASCAALVATSAFGCIATSPVDFPEFENFPPSLISQPGARYPTREIGQLNLDSPDASLELPLQVNVRDPNIDQTLEFRIFVDSPTPPGNDFPIDAGFVDPTGEVSRPRTFTVSYDELTPAGVCHKIELVVSGAFVPGFIEPRRPVEDGDVDDLTWWIRVTDADNPIAGECQ